MTTARDDHPFECDLGPGRKPGTISAVGSGRQCLLHHLVLAADHLSDDGRSPFEAAHFNRIAARLRDMTFTPEWAGAEPQIATESGSPQPLMGLLAEAWEDRGGVLPLREIDPHLFEAAEELLRGLAWEVPDGRNSA